MLQTYANGTNIRTAKTFADFLTDQMNTGIINNSNFTAGIDLADPQATALIWASDANAQVCETVFAQGVAAVEKVDLSGAYTDAAQPVVELQLAKAGVRYVLCFVRKMCGADAEIDLLLGWI
jgi:hypothetical protein